jgi:putative transcription factor
MSYQITDDMWEAPTIVLRKNKEKKDVVKAQRDGKTDSALKKKCVDEAHKNRKLDETTDAAKHKTVGKDMGQKIIKARCEKKLTQKQLAQKINKPVQIITTYETGAAILDNKILSSIKRVLGIKT